jgi:hypothetical protein
MTLILRKLLASSTYAIYGTLDSLVVRLENLIAKSETNLFEQIELDFETLDEIQDEWVSEDGEDLVEEALLSEEDIAAIKLEIEDLKRFRELAQLIRVNSKAEHLFTALAKAFEQLKVLGANEKALILQSPVEHRIIC